MSERFFNNKMYKLSGGELNQIMDIIEKRMNDVNTEFKIKEDNYKKEIEKLKQNQNKTKIVYRKR